MKKKIFLISVMVLALISIFAISVFADELIASKTVSEKYGTVIQLTADPGLDNAKQYVSTLNKINDSGTDKDALCILTDGTYFYVFPSSYIVNEREDGVFDLIATQLATAITEFNTANETSYYADYATDGSGGNKRLNSIVSFVFPSSVTSAKDSVCCMRTYSNLVEVRINHSIDFSNAEKMFYSNKKLASVIGFENVDGTKLSKTMFASCSAIRYIKLPTNIVKIPGSFFQGAKGVNIVNMEELNQLTTIESWAFDGTKNLVITLPDSVTTLYTSAFENAFSEGGSLTINPTSQLKTIGNKAFRASSKLSSIYIPSTVTSIGESAFDSSGITTLENFENCQITTIVKGTFEGASSLTSIKIPETVTTIENAFLGNKNLKTVYIPTSVTTIADTFVRSQYIEAPTSITFLYIGNDVSVFADCAVIAGANIIAFTEYDQSKTYTGFNLITGYSHCIAYKNGVHSSTVIDDIVTSYYETIDLVSRCVECGVTEDAGQIPAFFICLGYSTPENGRNGIAICFRVNNKAISLYKDATGKDVEYGIFAVAQSRLGDNDIFNEDGSKSEGVVDVEISKRGLVEYDFILTGFTDANKDAKLAIGTYIAVTKGETTEYSYMQADKPCENEKYHFISYSDIVTSTSSEN